MKVRRAAALVPAEAVMRIIESLSEHALWGTQPEANVSLADWCLLRHAPEYVAMIFHKVRWEPPNNSADAAWSKDFARVCWQPFLVRSCPKFLVLD